ncbi:type II toxin-antitoxin system RelE family toxin [Geotalea uraniireducens]|uniref:Addiction module toxin, RelE/StbE family n=1 Tax=Geotalea uraniireducens (strain Rf4) TaxID=351605 RepID=A5G3C1_GEOUR|nr:type II toxin-antitoxin system RelE/ParE family toxin [Geotalea uraniireducens]ABQ26289.1 addiction module toxin, RelE/StbE family [Geotalea uraniireducens Rf4]
MTYRIELTKTAERDLLAVPKPVLKRLDACILGLADDPLPPGVKKLKNSDGLYRVRVSDYRIIYRIEQEILTVLVVKIGHRREVYR